jgi:hypothetical protein
LRTWKICVEKEEESAPKGIAKEYNIKNCPKDEKGGEIES